MKLFNWINPLWIMDNFLTTRFDPVTATAATTAASQALPAVAAPSILSSLPLSAGGFTGAGMMTSSQLPGLMASSTPGLLGNLGSLGGAAFNAAKANPFQTLGLGMNVYDRMNPSQAPLQPSPMQQLIKQQQGVPPAEFNSIAQLPRRPIYIG
jgi:hypothetical protein